MPDTPNQEPHPEDDSSLPLASSGPRTCGSYGEALSPRNRKRFAQTSGAADLTEEIRLTRVVIQSMLREPQKNQDGILRAVNVLSRCASLQHKAGTEASSVEKALLDMANSTLDELERKAE